jgi:hypothetical protein
MLVLLHASSCLPGMGAQPTAFFLSLAGDHSQPSGHTELKSTGSFVLQQMPSAHVRLLPVHFVASLIGGQYLVLSMLQLMPAACATQAAHTTASAAKTKPFRRANIFSKLVGACRGCSWAIEELGELVYCARVCAASVGDCYLSTRAPIYTWQCEETAGQGMSSAGCCHHSCRAEYEALP